MRRRNGKDGMIGKKWSEKPFFYLSFSHSPPGYPNMWIHSLSSGHLHSHVEVS